MKTKFIAVLFLGILMFLAACIQETAQQTTTTSTTIVQTNGNVSPANQELPEELVPFSDSNDTVEIGDMV